METKLALDIHYLTNASSPVYIDHHKPVGLCISQPIIHNQNSFSVLSPLHVSVLVWVKPVIVRKYYVLMSRKKTRPY